MLSSKDLRVETNIFKHEFKSTTNLCCRVSMVSKKCQKTATVKNIAAEAVREDSMTNAGLQPMKKMP